MSLTTSLSSRVSERDRARRRSRLRLLLLAVALAAVAMATGWLVLWSSALGVAEVSVTGVARLSPAQVSERAAIAPGTPLARLDTDAVVARVSTLAVVEQVEVLRRWPRAVEITVRERTPAAGQLRGSSWVLVDRSGVAFATQARRPRRLPVLSAPVDAEPAALRAALDVLDVLPAGVRDQVRQVSATDADNVTMRLARGRTVVWGSTDRAQRKASVLAVLLSRKASVYDVSAPDIPTTSR